MHQHPDSHRWFTNEKCEYYPCHEFKEINCLFCFCPLYWENCGGRFTMLESGVKDCGDCTIPHTDEGYDYIMRMLKDIAHERLDRGRAKGQENP